MRADQIDEELKSLYRQVAEGRVTDEAAEAAEAALQARRASRERAGAAEPPRPALGRPGAPLRRREKMFGLGRPRALDRNAKVRIMHWARCLSRRTEKGRHYGRLTAKFVEVLRALLWSFHNRHSGICFPSLATIAEAAGCSRATVATAIKALEGEGLLTWVNRVKRVREPCPELLGADGWRWRVLRTSNSYAFNDPLHTTRAARYEGACQAPLTSPANASDGLWLFDICRPDVPALVAQRCGSGVATAASKRK